jgi:hypothetical protein
VYDGTGTKDGRLTMIAWRPRRNPCGKVIERVKMDPNNCCDEVEPLAFDWDSSVEVLEPDSSGFVSFTGGRLPALVKIRGNGFSLDGYNTRDAWTYHRTFRVYAHAMACGTAPIAIDDGCTVASGAVRSSLGHWTGGCYRYHEKAVGEKYSDIILRTPVALSPDGCAVIETALQNWQSFPEPVRYYSIEGALKRWDRFEWENAVPLQIVGGDILADEWDAVMAQISVPVVTVSWGTIQTDPPQGSGAAYSCNGSDCRWLC